MFKGDVVIFNFVFILEYLELVFYVFVFKYVGLIGEWKCFVIIVYVYEQVYVEVFRKVFGFKVIKWPMFVFGFVVQSKGVFVVILIKFEDIGVMVYQGQMLFICFQIVFKVVILIYLVEVCYVVWICNFIGSVFVFVVFNLVLIKIQVFVVVGVIGFIK